MRLSKGLARFPRAESPQNCIGASDAPGFENCNRHYCGACTCIMVCVYELLRAVCCWLHILGFFALVHPTHQVSTSDAPRKCPDETNQSKINRKCKEGSENNRLNTKMPSSTLQVKQTADQSLPNLAPIIAASTKWGPLVVRKAISMAFNSLNGPVRAKSPPQFRR